MFSDLLKGSELSRVQDAIQVKLAGEQRVDGKRVYTSENLSTRHELKPATRKEKRRLIGLARSGQRQARIVRLPCGMYAVGVHHNSARTPWRIVPVSQPLATIKIATRRFSVLLGGRTPPVRVFDEAKNSEV